MNNLDIYIRSRGVPKEAQKTITAGRLKGMTDINPMWRIKKLTELFGPCGVGWWYEIKDKIIVEDTETKQRAAFIDILLFYVDPETGEASHGIPGTGGSSFVAQERNGPYMSDECFKMALTDAISVAAKMLGVGADVYFASDRDKYLTLRGEPAQTQQNTDMYFRCQQCGAVLKPYKDKSGRGINICRHAEEAKAKFGKVLCLDCINQINGGTNENG